MTGVLSGAQGMPGIAGAAGGGRRAGALQFLRQNPQFQVQRLSS
jgi:hypothetical protein